MQRIALLALLAPLLAGCSGEDAADPEPESIASDAGRVTFDGRFDIAYVGGQEVSREGGEHDLAVPQGGWRNVNVELDVQIDAVLVLLPPGCASTADACALRQPFPAQYREGQAWLVPSMAEGTWKVRLEPEDRDEAFRSSVYTVTFEYVDDVA